MYRSAIGAAIVAACIGFSSTTALASGFYWQIYDTPTQITTGPEAGNWEYIYDLYGDGTAAQLQYGELSGFDASLIVNQVPAFDWGGTVGTLVQKWDGNAADNPPSWEHAPYGSYATSSAAGAWTTTANPGSIDNPWHTPDEYALVGPSWSVQTPKFIYPGQVLGDGVGTPYSAKFQSQASSNNLQDGLMLTVRIVHPNAPAMIDWKVYSFYTGDVFGTMIGPGDGGPACIVGDANCDGYVDVGGDIFAAFGNFTGPGTFGMSRIDGDVQGNATGATAHLDPHDGDVDVSDIITMFSNFTGPAPPEDGAGGLVAAEALDSAIPDLIYDASTGEVLLDLDSAVGFTGYVLNSANGFITGNHTPFMAGVTTTLPYELAEATFGTPAGPYPKSIGQVFPSGMDMTALSAFLTGNQVSRGNNQPIVPFDLVIVNPVSSGVPEPAAVVMGLMALAGLGMVAYRRRRNG